MRYAILLLAIPLSVQHVSAQEEEPTNFSITTGVLVPVLLSDGNIPGVYSYTGINMSAPFSSGALIGGIGFAVMPEQGNYGIIVSGGIDYSLNGWLSLNIALSVNHDESSFYTETLGQSRTFALSGNVGLSFVSKSGFAITPVIAYDYNLDKLGDTISFSLLASLPFPKKRVVAVWDHIFLLIAVYEIGRETQRLYPEKPYLPYILGGTIFLMAEIFVF